MNKKQSPTELQQENYNEENITNEVELSKNEKIIEENKNIGNKIPLYAIIFYIYYKAEKNTLKRKELLPLVKKEVENSKAVIISSLGLDII